MLTLYLNFKKGKKPKKTINFFKNIFNEYFECTLIQKLLPSGASGGRQGKRFLSDLVSLSLYRIRHAYCIPSIALDFPSSISSVSSGMTLIL